MDKILEIGNKQIIRGLVLMIAEAAGINGASLELIKTALKPHGYNIEKDEVMMVCQYLEGKGLIRIETFKNEVLKISRDIAYIMPDGIDVLEGTMKVDGINLRG